MRPSRRVVAVALLLLGPAIPSPAAAAARTAARPAVAPGRFVLRGTAHADLTGLPGRDVPLDVLALVAPGDGPGDVRLHLRSRGHECDLRARIDGAANLALAAGQVCAFELRGEPRGDVSGRLRSGTGRLTAGELRLELTWDVSGTVSASGGSLSIPGTSAELALPAVPVRGTVRASAAGVREASRAPRAARRRPRARSRTAGPGPARAECGSGGTTA